jgi:hypothetical protein
MRPNALDQTCSRDGVFKINQHEVEPAAPDLPVTVVRFLRDSNPLIKRTPQDSLVPSSLMIDSLLHRGLRKEDATSGCQIGAAGRLRPACRSQRSRKYRKRKYLFRIVAPAKNRYMTHDTQVIDLDLVEIDSGARLLASIHSRIGR